MSTTDRICRIAFVLVALCLFAQFVSALTVEELLTEMPAKDSAHAEKLYEQIAAGDEAVIVALCDSLSLWQEDADPRVPMVLDGLADHVMRPENTANRAKVARLYEAALNRADSTDKQRFFMQMLRVCGDNESVTFLTPYLCNADLFDDAIYTLEAIGDENVITLLESATCPDLPEAFAVAVKTALMRMRNTVAFEKDTTGLDALVLAAASGPPEPEHAERVAALCREALQDKKLEPHVQALALRALVNAVGIAALPDLLSMGESPEPRLWGVALQLSESLPGIEVSRAWIQQMDSLPEPVRLQIIYMLGGRNDDSARAAIHKALRSKNAEMRIAACDAVGRCDDKSDFMTALERAMTASTSSRDIGTVKAALLQLPEPGLSEMAARNAVQGENPQRMAYLEILASRRSEQHLKPVRECLANEAAEVRRAALDTVAVIGAPEDMETIFDHLLSEDADREVTAARNALIAIADAHDLRPAVLRQIQSLFNTARSDSQMRLLKTLSALGDTESLAEVGKIVEAALIGEDRDEVLGNAALETLGTWQDVRAGDLLLDLLGRVEIEEQRMAVLLQIAIATPRIFSDAPQQIKFLEKAQVLCATEAEKQIVVGAIEKAAPPEK